jgi:hypothetical protein
MPIIEESIAGDFESLIIHVSHATGFQEIQPPLVQFSYK